MTFNDAHPKTIDVMISHCWDEPVGTFLRHVLMVTEDRIDVGIFICFLSVYQGTPEEVDLQVTQGSADAKMGCFAQVLTTVKQQGGQMIVISNQAVVDKGLYSRLWCVWEVFCAAKDDVPIRVHPLTGTEKHLFGEVGKRNFDPSLARCGNPSLPPPPDEARIKAAIETGAGWNHIRDVIHEACKFTTWDNWTICTSGCMLGPCCVKALFQAVESMPHVTRLEFFYNGINDGGVETLAEMLKQNNTLSVLALNNSNITDRGAQALAEMLKINHTMTTLRLTNNKITDRGAQALAEMLKSNRTLTELRLHKNNISDRGAQALAEMLKSNNTLRQLYLMNNNITDHGAQALAEMLKQNHTLTMLVLNGNNITDRGAQALRKVAQKKRGFYLDF